MCQCRMAALWRPERSGNKRGDHVAPYLLTTLQAAAYAGTTFVPYACHAAPTHMDCLGGCDHQHGRFGQQAHGHAVLRTTYSRLLARDTHVRASPQSLRSRRAASAPAHAAVCHAYCLSATAYSTFAFLSRIQHAHRPWHHCFRLSAGSALSCPPVPFATTLTRATNAARLQAMPATERRYARGGTRGPCPPPASPAYSPACCLPSHFLAFPCLPARAHPTRTRTQLGNAPPPARTDKQKDTPCAFHLHNHHCPVPPIYGHSLPAPPFPTLPLLPVPAIHTLCLFW